MALGGDVGMAVDAPPPTPPSCIGYCTRMLGGDWLRWPVQ